MKKPGTGSYFNQSRAKMVSQQKKDKAMEAGLKARKVAASKAIAIGSAALGVIALSLFTFSKLKKKKRGLFF